jgi:hypothetical protein
MKSESPDERTQTHSAEATSGDSGRYGVGPAADASPGGREARRARADMPSAIASGEREGGAAGRANGTERNGKDG